MPSRADDARLVTASAHLAAYRSIGTSRPTASIVNAQDRLSMSPLRGTPRNVGDSTGGRGVRAGLIRRTPKPCVVSLANRLLRELDAHAARASGALDHFAHDQADSGCEERDLPPAGEPADERGGEDDGEPDHVGSADGELACAGHGVFIGRSGLN